MDIVHRTSVELLAVLSRMLATRREGSMIAVPVIEMMIYVPVKVFRAVKALGPAPIKMPP